jgi:ketosteroid isomerase-like protein
MRLVEAVDVGDDRVLAVVHQSATGRTSGAAVELDFGIVYTLDQGRVVDRKDYKLDDARKAAGLSR